jgi:hypothetical protein
VGFISNQWLKGEFALRNRKHVPVSVTITAINPSDSWSERNQIKVEFTARRENLEHKSVHLTTKEAEAAVKAIISACGNKARTRVARELLRELSDKDLLRLLAHDLRIRTKDENLTANTSFNPDAQKRRAG